MEKVNKDFGWANGWSSTPEEIAQAEKEGYTFKEMSIGRCMTMYVCEELGITYRVDSSD